MTDAPKAVAPPFVLLEQPNAYPQLLRVEGARAAFVGVVPDQQIGARIVELLNRHGLEDVPIPIVMPTDQEGTPCPPAP